MKTSEVFGFNYDGSWGSSGLDVWTHHDHGLMSVEIARGKDYFPEWNTARWWLSQEAYQRAPAKFLANFDAGLQLFANSGIKVIPVLFNRWCDPVCDFGGVHLEHLIPWGSPWSQDDKLFASIDSKDRQVSTIETMHTNYIESVVGEHAGDERIYSWDLCNEPLMGSYVDDPESLLHISELRWLTWLAAKVRSLPITQPVTIGIYPLLSAIKVTEPLVDIISFHPYYQWNKSADEQPLADKVFFEKFVDDVLAFANAKGKGLVANETVWGARDDAKHVEVIRYTLGVLFERKIGFTAHALHHSLISDLHRDEFGPVGWPECLHFIEADGSLRKGHEAFNEFAPSRRQDAS